MGSQGEVTRVRKNGASLCLMIPKAMADHLRWRSGDTIVARYAGEKVILERVPFEKMGIIRTGEAEVSK
jgi:antitoxin component of MazEF toxin-antitoxin module